jgi:DNA-binding MarR family transcriptional regulator
MAPTANVGPAGFERQRLQTLPSLGDIFELDKVNERIYRIAIVSLSDVFMTNGPDRPNYKAMAELRYQIRRFLRFSENAARQAGIEPQQHQLLLAVRGLPDSVKPTIGVLAERMQLQHHSTVELIDRLVERNFLFRLRSTDDKRQVLVKLTHDGEEFLQKLSLHHLQELQSAGPTFVNVLQSLIQESSSTDHNEAHSDSPKSRKNFTKG